MDADDKTRKNCTDASDVGASRKRASPELAEKEKQAVRRRCVGEDDGVGCTNYGVEQDAGHHLCGKHGGTRECYEKDCKERTVRMAPFCPAHQDAYKVKGCLKQTIKTACKGGERKPRRVWEAAEEERRMRQLTI